MQAPQEQVEMLQNALIARATGCSGVEDNADYSRLRTALLAEPAVAARLPSWVRATRTLDQFWPFIKAKFPSYAERREFIWSEFRSVFELWDGVAASPSDLGVTHAITKFDGEHIHGTWQKALERRNSDPEGAITSARTLLNRYANTFLTHPVGDTTKGTT